MKHFLKPLGHCLTTAVMTSAMLQVYALPPVEAAASPEPSPQPPSANLPEAEAASSIPLEAATVEVAPPEAAFTPEFAPAPTAPPTAPSPTATIPVAPAAPASSPASSAISLPKPESIPHMAPVVSEPKPAQPQAEQLPATPLPAPQAPQPQAPQPQAPQPQAPQAQSPKKVGNSDSVKNSGNRTVGGTVAGMRQVIEKRLDNLVAQDKSSRESQWQQNLIYTALQYAWRGQFDYARQIAAHPALPLDLKVQLLDKIAAIEIQQQPSQVAQQSKATNKAKAQVNGRVVPSGYPTVGMALPTYSGAGYSVVPNQCPAFDTSNVTLLASKTAATRTQPSAQTAPTRPTTAQAKTQSAAQAKSRTSRMPSYLPALGQNMASRMVQLSQTKSVAALKASIAKAVQQKAAQQKAAQRQPVSPNLFVGVASNSLKQAIAKPTAKPAKPMAVQTAQANAQAQLRPARPLVRPIQSGSVQSVVPNLANPNSAGPNLTGSNLTGSTPAVSSPAAPPNSLSQPFISTAFAAPPPASSQLNAEVKPKAKAVNSLTQSFGRAETKTAEVKAAEVKAAETKAAWSLDRAVSSTLNKSFEQFSVILPDWVPNPLNLAWDWWTAPNDQLVSFEAAGNNGSNHSLNSGFIQNWDQTWQQMEQAFEPAQGRNAFKFTVPTLAAQSAKPAAPNAAALLAMSCAKAQLADRLDSYVIDPATSKQLGWVNLMFPLPIAAVITSAFGWRVHPISGSLSFHAGLDLGAPMGTPVLAASSGRVVVADAMGGYGLAVVVENGDKQRNLYAHLSGIAVQPGKVVEQGTVLGWVGSTGNSTGPHLHFESQVETNSGWTTIDPLASAAVEATQ
jgi:murein DD-endopeptidase MepM/ murein hydrolase activator NlpD